MDEGDLAALLRQHAERYSVPGAAIGVLREGTAMTACFGTTDVTAGEPVTFVADPDNPTVTFGAFDPRGRPQVLYDTLWGLPRVGG